MTFKTRHGPFPTFKRHGPFPTSTSLWWVAGLQGACMVGMIFFSMLGAHFLEMMGKTKPARNVHGKNDLSSHGDEEEEDEEEEDHGNNEEEEEDDEDGSQYGNHQEKHTSLSEPG